MTAAIAWDPPGGIVKVTTWAGSLFAACFFPAVLLGLNWSRGNGAAVLASFATGTATLVLWGLSPAARWLHEVFPALLASMAAFMLVARASPPLATAVALFARGDTR
jgi:Na+/pantothenate symporter